MNDMLAMMEDDWFDFGCISFTDEAYFHLGGFVSSNIGDVRVPKTHIYVKHDHCILRKRPFRLQYPAKASSILFFLPIFFYFYLTFFLLNMNVVVLKQLVATLQVLEDRPGNSWFK